MKKPAPPAPADPADLKAAEAAEAVRGPVCQACGTATRLVSLESHPRQKHADIRTYHCASCGESVTVVVPHPNG